MKVEAQRGSADVRFRCEGFTETLWRDLEGGCVGALEACGAEQVTVTRRDQGRDGDSELHLRVSWR